jgi:ABC-type branched-subunit amino acid transport system substrate-binding protein
VDAACQPWQEQIDALVPPADATQLERWLDQLLPLVRKEVSAVTAVKPPAKQSDAKKAALFTSNLKQLERGLTRYRAAISTGDTKAIEKAIQEANAAGAAARGYALSLDVTRCGGYEGG